MACSLLLLSTLSACSPTYVLRAAYEEGKILCGREKISELIAQPSSPEELKRKLQLVLKARDFAKEIGLDPGDSFTHYYKLDRETFAWVLLASQADSFSLAMWWHPIVGSVPYKGFFGRDAAQCEIRQLEAQGYEIWLRGTDAISTLGWFNDPVMSTTLVRSDHDIVNTVLHESFHSTVWVPNHVDFNESTANFFGYAASVLFYEQQKKLCAAAPECKADSEKNLSIAQLAYEREMFIGDVLERLYTRLDELYQSQQAKEDKLRKRTLLFTEETNQMRQRYPSTKILQSINNAELMQLKLYLSKLRIFEALFKKNGRESSRFIAAIRDIQEKVKEDSDLNPFALVEEKLR